MAGNVERIEMTLGDGRRLVVERTYIWDANYTEPVGVDPNSARAWLNGYSIPVAQAIELIEELQAEGERRARGG